MVRRVITAAVLIPIVVALVWWAPLALLTAVAAVVAILAVNELFLLAERMGMRAFRKWTIFTAAAVFYSQYSMSLVETRALSGSVSVIRDVASGVVSLEVIFLIYFLGIVAIGVFSKWPLSQILPAIGISSAGLFCIAWPFSYVLRIKEIEDGGTQLALFTLVLIWVGDSAAYFVGKAVGRYHIAPLLSPKKTWEGAIANVLGSVIVALIFTRWMSGDVLKLVTLAIFANVAGQFGDLIESAYKRGASVKDSGTLVPGHGGMLDRIDSLIVASPVVWLLFQWFSRPSP